MKEQSKTLNEITEGAIIPQILILFFPVLMGTLFQQFYNTTDAAIVGKFVGKNALAAVGGTTSMVIGLFIGFFVSLSSGFAVIIAQRYGARDDKAVQECVHTAFAFSLITGVILTVLGTTLIPNILLLMNVPEEIMPDTTAYIKIYFIGIIPNLIYNIGAAILRAVGDTVRPLFFLIFGCICNVVLDALFVIVLKYGVRGAAIATILSQTLTSIMVVIVLSATKGSYRLIIKKIRLNLLFLKKMIYVGMPAGFQNTMFNIANITIQSTVNNFGTESMAAWAAYGKIDSTFWMSIQALGIAVTTFIGQNYGAGKKKRIKKGVIRSIMLAVMITLIIMFLILLLRKYVFLLFTNDENVIRIGISIIMIIAPLYLTYFPIEIFSSILRGFGDTLMSMLLTGIGICVFRVIWVFTAVRLNNSLHTLVLAYPLSWIITSTLFIIYVFGFSRLKNFIFRKDD